MINDRHAKTRIQIEALRNHVWYHSENDEQILALKDLISKLKSPELGSISKTELASRYGFSKQTLNRRLNTSAELIEDFNRKSGYTKYQKLFLPAEIEIIEKHLGAIPVKI
jgi:hypothetical protein